MTAILVKAVADLRRRRVQAIVIFLTVLLAIATATMALTLNSQTRDPYQAAFDAQKGAHLQVAFKATTDPRLLASTPSIIGASSSGGPYPATTIQFKHGTQTFNMETFGRDNPAGQVELLNVTAGRWAQANDEIVLILAAVLVLIGIGGVFNTLLLNTRERIQDTATLKALGMSPRQVMVMVAASAGLLALVAGLMALPLGLFLHRLLNDVISSSTGNETPPSVYGVFNLFELALIPLLGVAVAVVAALLPGRWAARTNVVEVLHSE